MSNFKCETAVACEKNNFAGEFGEMQGTQQASCFAKATNSRGSQATKAADLSPMGDSLERPANDEYNNNWSRKVN